MNRIYHPYWRWEDFKAGFYDRISGEKKEALIIKVVELFKNREILTIYMTKVKEWKYSCEHNLTNESMNRIAYIGQAASCIYCGASCYITMDAWNKLDTNTQQEADKIAEQILSEWLIENKNIQLCLSII